MTNKDLRRDLAVGTSIALGLVSSSPLPVTNTPQDLTDESDAPRKNVLIVEDEQNIRDTLADLFDVPTSRLATAATLQEAKSYLTRDVFDLIVTDIRLGARRDGGLQVMAAAGLLSPDAVVIVLTAFPDDDNRHASLRLGATHFLGKPTDLAIIAGHARAAGVLTAIEPKLSATA